MQQDGDSPDADVRNAQNDDVRPDGVHAEFEMRPPGSNPLPPRSAGYFPNSGEGPFPTEKKREGFFTGKKERPTLITEAQPSLDQQRRSRMKRYTILMGFRIPCLILAAGAYSLWSNALISLAIIGVSIPLPWIAVLVANDRPPRRKDEPSRWDARRAAKALEAREHRAVDG